MKSSRSQKVEELKLLRESRGFGEYLYSQRKWMYWRWEWAQCALNYTVCLSRSSKVTVKASRYANTTHHSDHVDGPAALAGVWVMAEYYWRSLPLDEPSSPGQTVLTSTVVLCCLLVHCVMLNLVYWHVCIHFKGFGLESRLYSIAHFLSTFRNRCPATSLVSCTTHPLNRWHTGFMSCIWALRRLCLLSSVACL